MSPTREISIEEKDLLQSVIDSVHRQFIEAVSKGRNIPEEKVVEIADGRIFSGEQAKTIGLIDELGNLQDAIDTAAQLAKIEGEPQVLYPEKKRPSIWDFLMGEIFFSLRSFIEDRNFNISYLLTPGELGN